MLGLFKAKPPLDLGKRTLIELLVRRSHDLLGEKRLSKVTGIGIDHELLSTEPKDLSKRVCEELTSRLGDSFLDLNDVHVDSSDESTTTADEIAISAVSGLQSEKPELDQESNDKLRNAIQFALELTNQFVEHSRPTLPKCRFVDDERFLETLLICLGWAPAMSHASLYSTNWNSGESEFWEFSRSGNLSAEEIGFALAALTQLSSAYGPLLNDGLSLDGKKMFHRGQKHFSNRPGTKHKAFLHELDVLPNESSSSNDFREFLLSDCDEIRLAALWCLENRDEIGGEISPGLLAASRSSADIIRWYCATLLGRCPPTLETIQGIEVLIKDSETEVAIAAVNSAYSIGVEADGFLPQVKSLLYETSQTPSRCLLELITKLGSVTSGLEYDVCKQLKHSLYHDGPVQSASECLVAIAKDPVSIVSRVFGDDHMQPLAMACLQGRYPTEDDLFRARV
jgi:hypothetical protein